MFDTPLTGPWPRRFQPGAPGSSEEWRRRVSRLSPKGPTPIRPRSLGPGRLLTAPGASHRNGSGRDASAALRPPLAALGWGRPAAGLPADADAGLRDVDEVSPTVDAQRGTLSISESPLGAPRGRGERRGGWRRPRPGRDSRPVPAAPPSPPPWTVLEVYFRSLRPGRATQVRGLGPEPRGSPETPAPREGGRAGNPTAHRLLGPRARE